MKPVLLVVAGPNGAGKTTVTERLRKESWSEGVEYINPDEIARDRFGDWNSPDAVLAAANWAATRPSRSPRCRPTQIWAGSPHRMKKPAAIYLRVSADGQTLENQRPELEQLARARNLPIVATYAENASAAQRRPEFDRMMIDARRGTFSVLLVWSLDRFGRSMAGNVSDALALDRAGVELISLREPWLDTDGPVRDLLLAIFSWVAEQEIRRLVERTRAGIERARLEGTRSGKPIGRPPRLPRIEVERAVALHAKGRSVRAIADAMHVPRSTVARALASHPPDRVDACPSCAGRRMANTAAPLVDRVLPAVPVRQWVLSLPWELRALAAFRAPVLSALGRIFVETIFARHRRWTTRNHAYDAFIEWDAPIFAEVPGRGDIFHRGSVMLAKGFRAETAPTFFHWQVMLAGQGPFFVHTVPRESTRLRDAEIGENDFMKVTWPGAGTSG